MGLQDPQFCFPQKHSLFTVDYGQFEFEPAQPLVRAACTDTTLSYVGRF